MSLISEIVGKVFHPQAAKASPSATTSAPPPGPIDVNEVLTSMARSHSQENLNWRTSIVDLLKVLELDSSQEARKQLAQELKYAGDTQDSASMNIWLHKEVMSKLAENGGKIPETLKH